MKDDFFKEKMESLEKFNHSIGFSLDDELTKHKALFKETAQEIISLLIDTYLDFVEEGNSHHVAKVRSLREYGAWFSINEDKKNEVLASFEEFLKNHNKEKKETD